MIGNDIVDLALAKKESNWKRKGFLDKIFTPKEQLMISIAQNSEVMVWNLWSRKEAAYKIYNRETGIRAFNPLQLECFDAEFEKGFHFGKVIINEYSFFTKTSITNQCIYSVAVVKKPLFDAIKEVKDLDKIQKTNGTPHYFDEQGLISTPASVTHHGRFTKIIRI